MTTPRTFAKWCRAKYGAEPAKNWWPLLWSMLDTSGRARVTPSDLPCFAFCMLEIELPRRMERELQRLYTINYCP